MKSRVATETGGTTLLGGKKKPGSRVMQPPQPRAVHPENPRIPAQPALPVPVPVVSAHPAAVESGSPLTPNAEAEWANLAKWVAGMYALTPDQERFTEGLSSLQRQAEDSGNGMLASFLDRVLRVDPGTVRERVLSRLLENPALRAATDALCAENDEWIQALSGTSRLPRDTVRVFPWKIRKGTGALLWVRGEGVVFEPDASFFDRLAKLGCSINDLRNVVSTRRDAETGRFERIIRAAWDATHPDGSGSDARKDGTPGFIPLRESLDIPLTDGRIHTACLPIYGPEAATRAGLSVRLKCNGREGLPTWERTILWTGPTDWFDASGSSEIQRNYPVAGSDGIDLLFLHVGAVNDFGVWQGESGLGLSGAARVLVHTRPKLAVLCGLHENAIPHGPAFAEALAASVEGASRVVPFTENMSVDLDALETTVVQ